MKRLLNMGLLALACMSPLAMPQDVKFNYDPAVSFSKFSKYRWVGENADQAPDQLLDRQIRDAIDGQLTAKGLTKCDDDTANLYVAYHIKMSQEKQLNAFAGPGWRMGGGMSTATTSTINIGTLTLDMYDPSNKELVWKGVAQKTVDPSNNPAKNQQRLQKAMAKLLKNYPPGVKKQRS